MAEAVGAEPGPRLLAEVAAAGGNPLFVTELVAALLHEGAIQVAGGRAEAAGTTPPPNLRLTILRRLSFLPDDTLEALRPASTLAGCWDLCRRSGFAIEYPVLGADLVRLALAAGERARAERVAAAVDAYRRAPRPLELALAAEDAGAAFARRGEPKAPYPCSGRPWSCTSGWRRPGARPGRGRPALPGVRRGRRGPRKRPQHGWDSLTRTERQVVDLVVEGLSNPQIGEWLFVSPRTVQTHVAHVFTKLEVSSRAQLAAEATRHRQTPEPTSG